MQSQPASKCIYNDFNQCRTILERNRASLVTVERTSAFEEYTNLFMNPQSNRMSTRPVPWITRNICPLSSHSSVKSMTWTTTTERCERISIQSNNTADVIASLFMASLSQRKTPETPHCMFSTADSTCQSRPTASTGVID